MENAGRRMKEEGNIERGFSVRERLGTSMEKKAILVKKEDKESWTIASATKINTRRYKTDTKRKRSKRERGSAIIKRIERGIGSK